MRTLKQLGWLTDINIGQDANAESPNGRKVVKNRSVLKLYGSVAHQSEPFTLQQRCSTESVEEPHTSSQQTLIRSGRSGPRQKSK